MDKEAFKAVITTKGFWKQAFAQIKLFGITFLAALGSVWDVAQMYLETYVKDTVNIVLEEKNTTKSFREILGEEMGVPTDMVPYHIVDRFDQIDTLAVEISKFERTYVPHLDYQLRISPMYRFIDEDGMEYWMGPDRRAHGVLYDNGEAWCVYSNAKKVIGRSY